MTDPEWTEVRRLVEAAMDLEPGERAAFLAGACSENTPLRERVERLLRSEAQGLDDLEPPAAAELSSLLEGEGDSRRGERIGTYELRRRLGEGGMGSVWLAVRSDGEFHRQVAIKLIRPGMDSAEILHRFRRERQVLANLDHPGIARLIDGGATEAGLPYLVMELVPGLPIDEYCDENRLSTADRLQLFRKVCAALHYAHQRLVVHRDLKPSNILVTPEGEPKLLDFGIAKMLDPEKVSSSADLTGEVMKLMTPHYASPEQVRGRTITTASDLYSLGVILYQLLTGRLPHRLETTSAVEIERVICGEEPARPSTAITRIGAGGDGAASVTPEVVCERRSTTPRALRRTLSGDLDQIVLAALRKEPARRYASVQQLAEDVERYQRGEPVLARPDSTLYRAGKFVRRHRLGVAASVAVLLSLVAGFITSTVQFGIASEARAAERGLREDAEEHVAELALLAKELEEETLFAQEQERLARGRLTEVEALSIDLLAQKELAETRFEEVRAFATSMVFDVLRELAPVEGALEAKALVSRLGLDHLDRLAADRDDDPRLRRQLVMGYVRMAELQGSASGPNFGRHDDALASFAKAIAIGEELVDEAPDDPGNAYVLAQALFLRGDVLRRLSRQGEAEEAYAYALEVCGVIEAHPSPAPGHRYVLSCVLDRLGASAVQRGEFEEARELYARSGEIALALSETRPSLRLEVATTHGRLADLNARLGDVDAAVELTERALAIIDEGLERNPTNASWRHHHRNERRQLARYLSLNGESEAARALAVALVEELDELRVREPEDARHGGDLLAALVTLTEVQRKAEAPDEALGPARRALALAEGLRSERAGDGAHLDVGNALCTLGAVERDRGEVTIAIELLERAGVIFDEFLSADAGHRPALTGLLVCHGNLARGYEALARESTESSAPWRSSLELADHHLRREVELAESLRGIGAFRPEWEEGLVENAERLATIEVELAGEGR